LTEPDTYAYNLGSYVIENLNFTNISRVHFDSGYRWYNTCYGEWWDDVSFYRSGVYLSNPNVMSMYSGSSYCSSSNRPVYDGWTFVQSDVQMNSQQTWTTTTASNPSWYRGTFIDTAVTLLSTSSFNAYLELRDSNFTATGSPSATAWQYSQYASQRGTAFITASTGSYGKWTVANNSFAPTNGWTGIEYTYSVGHMKAPYNWWGTNNVTTIDGLIEDMLDNNGGGWVNYSPFWTSSAMNQLDWNGTSPANIPLDRELSGSLFFSKTMTLNNSPYYLVGAWTVTPGVRITIDPGVQVYANTTNSSIIVHGEIHTLGTSANPVFIGVNPSISWTYNSGYWAGIKGQNPAQGNDPLLMRNTTVAGPSNFWYTPGQSYTGYQNLFEFRYFFRTSANVVVDNTTFQNGNQILTEPDTYAYNLGSYVIENLNFTNISRVHFDSGYRWYNTCYGEWWDD
ncbi:MAG TPA: hypothetical protein QF433_07040, partial [Candidatus Thalassarchaeaceae archaeon]|nr:hypothetical protein [Candidatus Thalassarchaeaceae archaeon]